MKLFSFKNFLIYILVIPNVYAQDLTQYVDPRIGTDAHGHTFPGPSMPFGMVQLSPDTRLDGWDGCSAYHNSDHKIFGFSHTHLSGTGCSDYGDILMMPSIGISNFNNGSDNNGYGTSFNKSNEKVNCGLYSVSLDNGIQVRLTSTLRSGMHEYTFPPSSDPWIIIDLAHRDKVKKAGFSEVIKNGVSGYRISSAWAREQHVYFALKTSADILSTEYSADSLKLILHFARPSNGRILIQCAISGVDEQGAQKNLQAEWQNFNFEKCMKENIASWNKLLSRINIETKDKRKKTIFYTSLYHTLLTPNLYQDIDNRYRGMDLKVHNGDPLNPRYTVFSLWDTYRAAHPLYQLVYPDYNKQFVLTFLGQYKEIGRLPVWELAANETYCMIGNHSIPVIADALLQAPDMYSPKEKNELIDAIEATLFHKDFSAQKSYRSGYIPYSSTGESVSKTIEDALDYAAYEKLIERFGNKDQQDSLIYFSSYYKNVFNEKTGFFQAKNNHVFLTPFDPREVNHHYTEANAYQYLFGAHHDIPGLVECLSRAYGVRYHANAYIDRRIKLEQRLDSTFYTSSHMTGRDQSDITGMIGQYAHGNEPSHHYAYLYNYSGKTYKAQKILNRIMSELYSDSPDGLCGNEDCGQMSAWYVFSSMGFYPVVPFGGMYDLGIPQFQSIQINVPGKNAIVITTERKDGDAYVSNFNHNGKINQIRFPLRYGDRLNYMMSIKPGMNVQEADINKWLQEENDFMPLTYVSEGDPIFGENTSITLKCPYPGSEIFYSLGDNPKTYLKYEDPILITEKTVLNFRSCRKVEDKNDCTPWLRSEFKPRPRGYYLQLLTDYAPQYSAGGRYALVDGQQGSTDYHDGLWQGTHGNDVELVIALEESWNKDIKAIELTALQDSRSWIILPKEVEVSVSLDNETYTLVNTLTHDVNPKDEKNQIHTFRYNNPEKFYYLKLKIKNSGNLGTEHLSSGEKSWIFIDEVKLVTE